MSNILELPTVRQRVAAIGVEAYHVFLERGEAGRRTELLRGVIVEKMTKSPLHEFLAAKLFELARAAAGSGRLVRKEGPLTLVDSEPEPDVSVADGNAEDYRNAHPATALVAMEVSVSTEEADREKISIYAEAGVTEFWLVLPAHGTIEIFTRPAAGGYAETRVFRRGEVATSQALPELRVDVGLLLG